MKEPFTIDVALRDISQMFEPPGPLTARPRPLDPEVCEEIERQAARAPRGSALKLVFRSSAAIDGDPRDLIAATYEYFSFLADVSLREIRRILHEGWLALLIGLCFLAVAAAIAELIREAIQGRFLSNVATGLEIFGWVALWRPAELLLYEWMPLYRRRLLMKRLAQATVECRPA